MNECINGAKKIIDIQVMDNEIKTFGIPFSEFQKVYFSTNENINGYLNLVDLNNKEHALSVMASGDHILNLITNNIKNIDTFDTNRLTEYFVLGIKRSLILKNDYKNYLKEISLLIDPKTETSIINQIICDLLPYMEIKHRKFWKEIISFNYKIQNTNGTNLNLIQMLYINVKDVSNLNNYLLNEENYNILKSNIISSNITFKHTDAYTLDKEYNKKYDLILLSNIIDYFYRFLGMNWGVKELDSYVNKLNKIRNDKGIIFLNYIYRYYSNNITRCHKLIMGSNVNTRDLDAYTLKKIPQHINVEGNKVGDGILIN